MHKYSIDFLLTLRPRAVTPANIQQIVATIQEGCTFSRPDRQLPKGRGTGGKEWRQRPHAIGSHTLPQGRYPRQKLPPGMEVTKMPLKTSKSEVILLLNKLGADNIQTIAEQIHAIFEKAAEGDELLAWIHGKTLAQPDLADVFAKMWLHIFKRDAAIRIAYLNLCSGKFRGLTYEPNEDADDRILELCHAMRAMHVLRVVDQKPLVAIMSSLTENITMNVKGCSQGLDVLAFDDRTRKALATVIDRRSDAEEMLRHMFSTVSAETYCTTVYPIISYRAAVGHHLDTVLSDVFFDSRSPPSALQVNLLMTMKMGRDYVERLAVHLIALLPTRPEVVEPVLVIFKAHGSLMQGSTVASMKQAAIDYIGASDSSMRLKFQYMDFQDLVKSDWKPRHNRR